MGKLIAAPRSGEVSLPLIDGVDDVSNGYIESYSVD